MRTPGHPGRLRESPPPPPPSQHPSQASSPGALPTVLLWRAPLTPPAAAPTPSSPYLLSSLPEFQRATLWRRDCTTCSGEIIIRITPQLLNIFFSLFFLNTFILVQPKLIGVQFIKMTASFIHNDLQSWREDAGSRLAGHDENFMSDLTFPGHYQYQRQCVPAVIIFHYKMSPDL